MPETRNAEAPWRLIAAADTWIGRREHNEDTVLLRPDLGLYVLADGAGGENAGNVASALATTSVAHHFEETQEAAAAAPLFDDLGLSTGARRVAAAVQRANRDIIGIAKTSDRHHGMGTTIVVTSFDRGRGLLHVAHVGDSRCYRLRDGRLELLTHDHTLVNDVLELAPDLDDAKSAKLPRHVITRALGMSETIRVSVRSHQLAPKDRYLICSDGLTDVVDDGQLADALALASTAEEQVRLMMDLARDAEADDNVAVIVASCELASGISAMPKPTPTRAHPRTATSRPVPAEAAEPTEPRRPQPRESDYPEILIVGDGAREDPTQIHMVPALATDRDTLDAVHGFYERTRSQRPPPPPEKNPEGSWEDD